MKYEYKLNSNTLEAPNYEIRIHQIKESLFDFLLSKGLKKLVN